MPDQARDVGIILKSFFPYQNKISVLGRESGKRNLQVKQSFSPGTIIMFPIRGRRYEDLEVVHVPLYPIKNNLCWVHHLLEICYYFVPLHESCTDIFRLLQYSLRLGVRSLQFEEFGVVKRLCVVRLLVLLGFYPPAKLVYLIDVFDNVVVASLDSANDQKVLLRQVKDQLQEINAWILRCLWEHPNIKSFKTLSFFKNV